jgi:protein XagA
VRIRRILAATSLLVFCLAPAPTPAHAGAFLAPPGDCEIITATSFSDTTRIFDANGNLLPVASYKKFDLGSYIEYGLTDRITLVLKPQADIVHQSGQTGPPAAASSDIGARVGVLNFGNTILSAQGLVHVPVGPASAQAALFDEDRAPGADLRLLLGHGFAIATMSGFVDVEASHTWRGDGLPQEWHADLTFGIRPQPQILLMLASFATLAGNRAADCTSWRVCWTSLKLQPSVVYDVSPHWSAQAGVLATVAGQNAGRELGPILALWYRF